MTWEQKFSEVFPYLEQSKILAGEDGILNLSGDYFSNLEKAIISKNHAAAQKHYNENFDRFQAYKRAWKLYKKYPGPKQTIPTGNCWSDANIAWNGDQLRFPVPRGMEMNIYLLKASRMLAHWETRVTKGLKGGGSYILFSRMNRYAEVR